MPLIFGSNPPHRVDSNPLLAYFWRLLASRDDFYADASTFGSDSLADGFTVQRCAAAVAGLERISAPFSVDASVARTRFADALLNVLRTTNADPTLPPTPLVSGQSTSLNARLGRFATELSALLSVAGPGSAAASWATTRLRALRGEPGPASEADSLLSEVLRRPGLASPSHTGANLLATPWAEWPDWMVRRAGLDSTT